MPLTLASIYRQCESSWLSGSPRRVSSGLVSRARMATPFQDFCPCQMAPYPAERSASAGNEFSSAQFLEADDIGSVALQPLKQVAQARANAIDVEGGNFQTIAVTL